ncbi:hypothetical protein [Nocardia sp. BMG111209]|uniref:hypothetical protein n=1 Tax=Nocardia sp. BMG111209 TaxID=1160137 RepID=UPI0018CB0D4A|nr:hypothetical protein [Nocardia sp. BMG111209]
MSIAYIECLPAPKTRARERENRRFAEELQARPGTWAVYPWPTRSPHSTKHRIRAGLTAAFGPGFEAEVRDGVVHVRYAVYGQEEVGA